MNKLFRHLLVLAIATVSSLSMFAQPSNDSICNALPVSVGLGCVEGTNVGSTISETAFNPSCWGGSPISHDVWFKFVATSNGITVSTDVQGLSLANTQVAVYKSSDNTCTGTLTQVGCDDNSGTNVANNSIVNMATLVPGDVYYVRVDGSGNTTGTFCINVSDTYVPGSTPCEAQVAFPNNLACNVAVARANGPTDNGNRVNNAITPVGFYPPIGTDYCGGDDESEQYGTWVTFIANSDSVIITNYVNDERDYNLLKAASVNSCTNLTCVDYDSVGALGNVTFKNLTIGAKYFVLTTLRNGSKSTGFRSDFCIKSASDCTPPANNDCSNAQIIEAENLYNVTTYCATPDGNPNLCAGSTENNIWFKWTVPNDWDGNAFFQLFQQNCAGGDGALGSQVSVYAPGTDCGSSATCTGGATSNTQTDNNVNVMWTPTPGGTYLISYDGFASAVCTMKFQITNKASTNVITVNSAEICPGGTAVLTASGADSYLWDTGETTASITVSPSKTTSYNVTSTSGKSGSAIASVIVKPIPHLVSSLTPIACSGQPFNYAAESSTSGTTFKWSRKAVTGVSNAAKNGSGDVNETLVNTTLLHKTVNYVYVSTANGCTNGPAGDTVVVDLTPAAVIFDYATTVCSGETFTLSPTNGLPSAATKIPAGTQYKWSAPSISPIGTLTGDTIETTGKDTIIGTLTNTTYSLSIATYTITPTLNGCEQTPFVYTVTVRPSDNPSFNYAKSTYCQNDFTADTLAYITGLAGGTFKSTPGLVFDAVTGKFELAASTLGSYDITYVTNGICIDSSSFNVTITLAPDATFNYDKTAYCQQTIGFTSPVFPTGASAGLFTAAPVVGLNFVSPLTGEIDIDNSLPGTYTVTNTIAAAGTCQAEVHTFTVTINPVPVITNTIIATTICSGATLNIPLTTSIPSQVVWTTDGNTSITGESTTNKTTPTLNDKPVNVSLLPQSLTYTVSPKSVPQTCSGAAQYISVTVNPKPNMTSSGTAVSICSGENIELPLTSDVASSFKWIAASNTNIVGESTTQQLTDTIVNTLKNNVTSQQTVTYSITPTSTLGACLGSTQVRLVRVNPVPKMTGDSSKTLCSGASVVFSLNSDVASSYVWYADDNTHIAGETTTPKNTRTFAEFLINDTSNIQTVIYYATPTSTAGTCVGTTQTLEAKVYPTPIVTSVDSVVTCSGIALNHLLKATVASTYQWIAADNASTSGEPTSTQTGNTISSTIINSTLLSENVYYTVTPTSTALCLGLTDTLKVIVHPNPTMTGITDTLICGDGSPVGVSLKSDIPSIYSWKTASNANVKGESVSAKINDTIIDAILNSTTTLQTLTYTVIPTSIIGSCIGTEQLVTVQVAQPIAEFSFDPENGTPPITINFTNTSENSNTYEWIYGDGVKDTVSVPSHTYTSPNVYTVKLVATNNRLCPDTASAELIIYKLIVSNVFTPNNDGINDYFTFNKVGIASLDLEIYSRWGLKLFESHTVDAKWDGVNSSGKPSEEGTYFYLLKATGIDGQQYTEKGYINLIR